MADRIGRFSRDFMRFVDRGIEPLVNPPPVDDRTATDIAFAASVMLQGGGAILLYR